MAGTSSSIDLAGSKRSKLDVSEERSTHRDRVRERKTHEIKQIENGKESGSGACVVCGVCMVEGKRTTETERGRAIQIGYARRTSNRG